MTMSLAKNLLITGNPGIGKTTILVWLARALSDLRPAGFVTHEIRENGIRQGFLLVSCSGKKRILAHTDIQSPVRLGKYGIDLEGFERFLEEISLEEKEPNLVIIDEIGKMECFSTLFRELVLSLLASERPVIATIAKRGIPFMEMIKMRPDVKLIEITMQSRNSIRDDLLNSAIVMLDNHARSELGQ